MTDDDKSQPEWTVLYHSPGKFKGRGEFLRLMLENAPIEYNTKIQEICFTVLTD